MRCPTGVRERLIEGNRGGGKTDVALMHYLRYVGKGFGPDWNGIVFRRTYPELADIVGKAEKWCNRIFPKSKFYRSKADYFYEFPGGEKLWFRNFQMESDYYAYHGHNYPFILFEELTTWPSPACLLRSFSLNRSSNPDIPKFVLGTTNPWGVGHGWVKARYIDPPTLFRIYKGEKDKWTRMRIRCLLEDNQILMKADPDYADILAGEENPNVRRAWADGDWNIRSGGLFDDILGVSSRRSKIAFASATIPRSWSIHRSFDPGLGEPFSVGWWAMSDGIAPAKIDGRERYLPEGSLIRLREWYGCRSDDVKIGLRLTASEVADGILRKEADWFSDRPILPGPSDNSVFNPDTQQRSFAEIMEGKGIVWERGDKSRGSRAFGWSQLRAMLSASVHDHDTEPHLYVSRQCGRWWETVPSLQIDDNNPDDILDGQADHAADETRYMVTWKGDTFSMTRRSLHG